MTDHADGRFDPMTFKAITANGRRLVLSPPLVLHPGADESGELLTAEDADLNLIVAGGTREELADEVTATLFLLWDRYAREADEKLSPAARRLKGRLATRVREDVHATTAN